MRMFKRILPLLVAAAASTAMTATAVAHPEGCGKEGDEVGEAHCFTDQQQAIAEAFSSTSLQVDEVDHTQNLRPLANLPKKGIFAPESAFGSDIAFQGNLAYQGNYEGVQITNISDPENPVVVGTIDCAGSQNDISVYGKLLFTSTDSSRAFAECYRDGVRNFPRSATAPSADTWEGIRVFDVSNPADPRYVTAVETDCGSHTHTLLPDLANGRVLLYVSSYRPAANTPDCQPPHDKISVVAVPLANPAGASVVAEPVLFPDGGFPGTPTTSATSGCHDITVYPAKGVAAGACMGEGVIIDISDPVAPKVLSSMTDPNFAFWHSATFTGDGGRVLFTDELGGGSGATCNPGIGPLRGADAIYDVADRANPRLLSYFKIPRNQADTENCVAHNGVFLPTSAGDYFVQAWYQGGTSIIDLAGTPREIAYFERGPLSTERAILGGAWSSYFYNGFIYVNDIQKGLDVLKFTGTEGAQTPRNRMVRLNAQTQEPLGR